MWYALQVTVFCVTVYYYHAEIAPEALFGHKILLGVIAAFVATKILSGAFYIIRLSSRLLLTLVRHTPKLRGSQKTGYHRRIS
jgi:hypothetical protein